MARNGLFSTSKSLDCHKLTSYGISDGFTYTVEGRSLVVEGLSVLSNTLLT